MLKTGQCIREFVTRKPWEKYCPNYINNCKHSSQKLVIVWGAIYGIQGRHLREFRKTAKQTRRGKIVKSITSIDYINKTLGSFLELWYKTLEKDGQHLIYM